MYTKIISDNPCEVRKPDHFKFVRALSGAEPIMTVGMNVNASLKLARWRFELTEAETKPEDDYHIVELKRSGGTLHRLDRKSNPLISQTIALGPAAATPTWVSEGVTEYSQLYLSTDTLREIASAMHDGTPVSNDDELMPEAEGIVDFRLATLIDQCENFCNFSHQSTRLELDAMGQLVGTYIIRNHSRLSGVIEKTDQPSLSRSRLSLVFDAIEENLARDLPLHFLAGIVDLSPYHFSRAFKVATNTTPHQYVLDRRVAKVCQELKHTDESIAEIAYATGFSSQAHMTDVFTKRMGLTPGQYRREQSI